MKFDEFKVFSIDHHNLHRLNGGFGFGFGQLCGCGGDIDRCSPGQKCVKSTTCGPGGKKTGYVCGSTS